MTAGLPRDAGRLDGFIRGSMASWVSLFQQLLAERSVFEHEHGVSGIVAARLRATGARVDLVAHNRARLEQLPAACRPFSDVPDRSSVTARLPGAGRGRSLALSTHLDIVPEGDPAQWRHPPFAGDIDGGIIHGRGAMDDRAGVVIAIAVLETIVALGLRLHGDLVFHFVLEDETTGNGTLLCLDAGHRADAAVIIDGTRLDRAIVCHAGQVQFDVIATGRSASVSVSHMGVNAVEILSDLLRELRRDIAARNDSRAEAWRVFPSPFQFVTQRVSADAATLMVPDAARATCYVTFPPPATLAGVQAALEQRVTRFADEHGLVGRFALEWNGVASDPVHGGAEDLGRLLQQSAVDAGLSPPELGPSTGTSDLRHLVAAGIPGLLYGPGRGYNPHRPDEHYFLDDLHPMIRLFVGLAERWCGTMERSSANHLHH